MNIPIAISICVILALIGFSSSFFLGNDNPVEESAECAIEQIVEQTIHTPLPVKIDLTPNSPETQTQQGVVTNGS